MSSLPGFHNLLDDTVGNYSGYVTKPLPQPGMQEESFHVPAHVLEAQFSDEPPGFVSRRYRPQSGTFCSARILLRPSSGFRLWNKSGQEAIADANRTLYRYAWRAFTDELEASDKSIGSWRQLAYYVSAKFPIITNTVLNDIANAIIEIALRDAEFARLAFRDPPYCGIRPGEEDVSAHDRDELTMTRVRSACGYLPRKMKMVEFIQEALDSYANIVGNS